MKIYLFTLFMTLVISVSLGTNLKTDITKKEIDMQHIKIDDIKLIKTGRDTMFSMNICNTYSEDIYFYKLFIPKPNYNIIWTFSVSQEGKEIRYKGARAKIKMMKFPEGYIAIKPNKCLPISVRLNKYFEFNNEKEIELRYFMELKCPSLSEEGININFTKTLLAE